MLFNAAYAEELRVATVEGQKLINFDIETSSKEQLRGNVYKGFITRVEPSLEACFVDYGTDKQGFLPFKEIDFRYLPEVNGSRGRDFSKLPVGTELIVQVEKDERGNKGAALTSYITLPGRYLVLMPNNSRAGGISRRIEGEERDELKALMSQLEVPHGMSVILRTAALGRVVEELQWDLTYLLKLWNAIRSASAEQTGSFLIYQESSLVIRSIRDHFSPDISEVLIDTEDVYNQACQFMAHVMPNFADRIKFYRDDVPLFSRFQIEHQIESAYARTVNLPSGGAIVIDHTEALTSVDVNSARANKGADIETTAFLTNLEAAEEIARQLRLRDLGGLVVVDYIDMENPRNQRELENHFKNQLGLDRARIQMGKLSKFGLLELSRQRLQASLDESSTIACPRCAGVGSIRGIESSALHVLRIIQEETIKNNSNLSAMHVQLPVDVATYLLNERRDDVTKIEARMKIKIVLIPNIHLDSPQYKIKKLTYDHFDANFHKSSYNLVETHEDTLAYKSSTKKVDSAVSKIPVVKNILPEEPAPNISRKSKPLFGGFFTAIAKFFTANPVETQQKKVPSKHQPSRNVRYRNESNNERSERNLNGSTNPRNGSSSRDTNSSQPNLTTNKTRPVPITKNNNRIQTVRSVNPNDVKNIDSIEVAPKPVRTPRNNANSLKNNKMEESSSTSKSVGETRVKEVRQNKPEQQKVIPVVAPKTSDTVNFEKIKPKERLDRDEVKPKNEVLKEVKELIIKDLPPIVGMDIDNVNSTENNVIKTNTAKELPAVPAKVAVVEVVDLGELQLVATNKSLLNQPQPVIALKPTKRFNDLIIEPVVVDANINYELVETKK